MGGRTLYEDMIYMSTRATSVTFILLVFVGLGFNEAGDAALSEPILPVNNTNQVLISKTECDPICKTEVSDICILTHFDGIVKCVIRDHESNILNCTAWCKEYSNGLCCDHKGCTCCSEDFVFIDRQCRGNVKFMIAAQVAVGAAILLAVSVLALLSWKMCFRNNLTRRNRVRAFCGLPQIPRRGSTTGSINSVQHYVIQKMRDRPPRYDESAPQMPPCYDEIGSTGTSPCINSLSGVFPSAGICTSPYYNASFEHDNLPPYTLSPSFPQTEYNDAENESASGSNVRQKTDSTNEEIGRQVTNNSNTNASSMTDTNCQYLVEVGKWQQELLDEAAGGFENPNFIPDMQEQHM